MQHGEGSPRDDSGYSGAQPTEPVQNQGLSAVDDASPATSGPPQSGSPPNGSDRNRQPRSWRRRFATRWRRTWTALSRNRGRQNDDMISPSDPAHTAIESRTRVCDLSRSGSPAKDLSHPYLDDANLLPQSSYRVGGLRPTERRLLKPTKRRLPDPRDAVPEWERDPDNPDPTSREVIARVGRWIQNVPVHPSIANKLQQPVPPSRPRGLEQSMLLDE